MQLKKSWINNKRNLKKTERIADLSDFIIQILKKKLGSDEY
jgi:hypothetical protein